LRFGGVSLGTLGDVPGAFPPGGCFCADEAAVAGFSPEPVGEPPGVTVGFAPIKFAGTDFFSAPPGLGDAPEVAFLLGGRTPGFSRLDGAFCPAIAAGELVV
jgi:hypothetical protein